MIENQKNISFLQDVKANAKGYEQLAVMGLMEVLFNETYIGSVVYSKTEDNIDTGHAVVKRDKEDWIIVPDRHEPLVSVEDYKLAHKMIARREYQPRKPTGGWQPSLIRCSVCGKGLDKYIGKYYRCRNKHLSKIDIFGLHDAILESTRVMALTQLKEFEINSLLIYKFFSCFNINTLTSF